MKSPFPNPNPPESDLTRQQERKWVGADTVSQQIMANLIEGVVVVDVSLRCMVWTGFMERLSGISAESLLGRNPLQASAILISFLKQIGVYSGVEGALQGNRVTCPDVLHTTPAGNPVWLAGECNPVRDINRGIIAVVVTLLDITERKRSEEILRRKGAELEEAQRLAQVASWHWDVKSDTFIWSDELFRIFGRDSTLSAPSYKKLRRLFAPESWTRLSAAVKRALKIGSPYKLDLEIVHADGNIRSISARGEAARDPSGLVVQLRGTVQDITERKRAEEVMRASYEQLQSIWNHSPAILFIKDHLGRYIDVNPVFLSLTSLPREQILGRTDKEIFPPDQAAAYRANDLRVLEENRPIECEETTEQKDGIHTSIVQKFPLRNAQGQPYAICGLVTDITERKRMQVALRDSEERLRLAVQVGKMYAYDWDVATDAVIRSEDSTRIFGLIGEPTSLTHQQFLVRVHPEDRATFINSTAERTPESPDTQITYRLLRPDGSILWMERTGHVFFDEQGRMVRMIGMVADITGRKLAETKLSLAHDQLRLAMESGKTVGWDRDVKSGRDSLFGDLQSIFGIPSEVYAGRVEDFHRLIHPEDRRRVLEAIDDAMLTRKEYATEFRILRPDGTVRWVAAKGKFYYLPDGTPERMLGTAVDITERKVMEEALRESEEWLRLAVQAGRMYAFDWDVATDLIIRSEEVTHIPGLIGAPIRLTKQQMLASVHPEDRAKLISSNTALTPESPNVQSSSRFLRPDGSVLWVEKTGHAFFDDQGRMVRMIGMVADVTERKLAEETLSKVGGRLIEAHEEERTRIARELHDDIGQQLALLANNLALMEQDPPDSVTETRNRVHEHMKHLQEISADIHAISHRLHSSKLEYLGIVAAAKGFCQEFSEQHNVEIDFTHSDIPATVPREISLCLFRVMQEALQNAVKHSGMRHFEVELCGAPDGIHLTVRDAGLGFDPEAVVNNRGLGVVSMQERVNLVKGVLSIDSHPGRGTKINARLPLSTKGESARAAGE
jgi:PAS domain S-box-containing protein